MMVILFYLVTLLGWVVYSYSQVDLNLTLFQSPTFLSFQNTMMQLGYYNRSLSALIFAILLGSFFIFYFLFFILAGRNKLTIKTVTILIAVTAFLTLFAYPAFSYDIFNYMFDARIVTMYGQNPWFHKALDFPVDPWTRFMRWTHRTYPYGPIWLAVTLIPSILGFGKFILTLIGFKILLTASYLACSWLIYKILKKIKPELAISGVVLFALNPLIIIESLISPHNEILMLLFLLVAIYFWTTGKKWYSAFFLLLSGGVKYLTFLILPIDIYLARTGKLSINRFQKIVKVCLIILSIALLFVVSQREPYPWYLVTIIGLAALLPENKKLQLSVGVVSIGTLLRYLPYLYTGDYSNEMQIARNVFTIVPIIILFLIYGYKNFKVFQK